MKCPYCLVEFVPNFTNNGLGNDSEAAWSYSYTLCAGCKRIIFFLEGSFPRTDKYPNRKKFMVYPKSYARKPLPPEVQPQFAADYNEACIILEDSPKASAALSRRCLQNLLRDIEKVKPGNLDNEIQQVIDKGKLPSHLSESIDAIRNIGNFAAHPIKSTNSKEIIDVEPGEAEWSLDVLEALFDYYFVQPSILKKKKDDLNEKLKEAGKKEMK